jgi:hypothetical protein
MGEGALDPVGSWMDSASGVDSVESASEGAESGFSIPGMDQITGFFRAAAGFVNRRALARATRAVPRTLHYIGAALLSGEVSDSVPAPHLSLGLAAQVAMDEALLAMAMTPRRFPLPGDYARVSRELAEAETLYAREGWIGEPGTYHRTPPRLFGSDVTTSTGWAMGQGYERLDWDSGFTPHPDEPGADRWMSFEPNRTASAVIVRHPEGPRPWVIAVHGFCMGFPFMDFQGLQVNRLHQELGMNVALPALPLHGPRRVTLVSGEPFLSFELMNAVHGLTQAMWDIRRLITYIRQQGATSISLYGVSLGAYAVSLLAGLEHDIDGVVSGIPVTDFPGLFHRHSPHDIRARSIEHKIMGGPAENVYRVVSPLSLQPKVPRRGRFIFAGYGDRLALPEQAQRLWEHWDRPRISWYSGGHVGYLWSKRATDFVVSSLRQISTGHRDERTEADSWRP